MRLVVHYITFLVVSLLLAGCSSAEQPGAGKLMRVAAADLPDLVKAGEGKVVLVNFWATWCGECKEEMPGLLKLRKELPEDDFSLVLFSADEPEDSAAVRRFLDSLGVGFDTYIKTGGSDEEFITAVDSTWSGALPMTLVFDRRGRQVNQHVGSRSYDQFAEMVRDAGGL